MSTITLITLALGFLSLLSTISAYSFCPVGCMCNDETLVVQCEKSKLDVLPITLNPSIKRLVLRNNKIKTVDAAFQFYGDLLYVDLSSNHLVSIPTRSFDSQRKLLELHLNKNKISSVTNVTFQGLRNLTVLNLRENFLEELTKGLFSILPKLEELNLGQNRISIIDPQAFDGLTSLRILYLDDNQLNVVPTHAFPPLGSLAELHLGYNVFTILGDKSFFALQKLTVLELSGSGLSNISDGAFTGLTALRTLSLNDNRLTVIPSQQLTELSRLEELTLGQNDFTSIHPDAFQGLANLRHLDISGTVALERVEVGAFSTNLNLESVTLASNKHLEVIEDNSMTGLPKLRKLILRNNNIATLGEGAATWSELRVLDLSENPLQCTCRLLWLRNILVNRNLTQALCAGPIFLKDRQLRAVAPEELGCTLQDRRQQALVGAVCVILVALLSALSLILYRYRRNVRDALKDYKWNKSRAVSRKEHEYQKTFSDDEYINRQSTMNYHHHHLPPPHHHHHTTYSQNNKFAVPTTEL